MKNVREEIAEFCGPVDLEDAYIATILTGATLEIKGIAICDLRRVMREYSNREEPMIQVDCRRLDYSEIFKNPRKAIAKFMELVG